MATLQALLKELTEALNALPPKAYSGGELTSDLSEIVGAVQRGRPRGPR